ncbi:aminoglycoside phosphotransferase family protein [Microtetraspora fusca]|uniref:Aminoglycoside phosphotransferase family protein n=1 Tax=Microtetraspora fusca TaxID=1997 RepID=A0ABW6VL75_MICFU
MSAACRRRLTDHYGADVTKWLERVPQMIDLVAKRQGLVGGSLHDAGCASVIATATDSLGTHLILKAWYDHDRFRNELTALRHWFPGPVPGVRHVDGARAVAVLEMAGGRPGGHPPPREEQQVVAEGLRFLHTRPAPGGLPALDDYLTSTVVPRVHRRLARSTGDVPVMAVRLGVDAMSRLRTGHRHQVLLHADLYRENVLFDDTRGVVFIDPLPMVGDPVFDWAFWTVYYDLDRDPVGRLRLATQTSGIPSAEMVPWCLTLCLDGLLYYREVGDPRLGCIGDVMVALAKEAR